MRDIGFWAVIGVLILVVFVLGAMLPIRLAEHAGRVAEAPVSLDHQIATLESQLEAAELQLGVYEGNERCLPLDVYISSDWGGGVLMVSQSELCGFNLHLSDKIWGPSTAAILQSKDEIIQELRDQIEALQLALEHERQQ